MYGMFKNKRIVLFDTLIEQCSEEQVVAVLAHELGMPRTGSVPCQSHYDAMCTYVVAQTDLCAEE